MTKKITDLNCPRCRESFHYLEGMREDGIVCPLCNRVIESIKYTPEIKKAKKEVVKQSDNSVF